MLKIQKWKFIETRASNLNKISRIFCLIKIQCFSLFFSFSFPSKFNCARERNKSMEKDMAYRKKNNFYCDWTFIKWLFKVSLSCSIHLFCLKAFIFTFYFRIAYSCELRLFPLRPYISYLNRLNNIVMLLYVIIKLLPKNFIKTFLFFHFALAESFRIEKFFYCLREYMANCF